MTNTAKSKRHDQYILRVKKGSPIHNVMAALDAAHEPLTNEQLAAVGGQKQWGYMLQWIAKMTDNVTMVKDWGENSNKMVYNHPLSSTPTAINDNGSTTKVQSVVADGSDIERLLAALVNKTPSDKIEESAVIWPNTPPVPDMIDNFRTPTWFRTMEEMIMLGKHIALAGPPGVGKDTAVIELAARLGKPLVIIGGDAGLRRKDLTGAPQISNGHSFFEVAEYAAAAVNGWWVLATEINAAEPDTIMYMNAQLAQPYTVTLNGKSYPIDRENFRLFVSYNPGLVGTHPLPQSFKDRFFSIQVPFFNGAELRTILEANGMPGSLSDGDGSWQDKIVKFGVAMNEAWEKGRMRYQITTRRLIDAAVLMSHSIVPDVQTALRKAVIAAIDSPVEQKAAETVLTEIIRGY